MTILPTPKITPTSTTTWTIDFRNGVTGSMARVAEQPRDRWDWTVAFADGSEHSGYSYGDVVAFERAHDTALLAAVLGSRHVSCQGVSVSPDDRASILRRIVGPAPEMASAEAV